MRTIFVLVLVSEKKTDESCNLFIYLFIYLSIYSFFYLFIYLLIYFFIQVGKIHTSFKDN